MKNDRVNASFNYHIPIIAYVELKINGYGVNMLGIYGTLQQDDLTYRQEATIDKTCKLV